MAGLCVNDANASCTRAHMPTLKARSVSVGKASKNKYLIVNIVTVELVATAQRTVDLVVTRRGLRNRGGQGSSVLNQRLHRQLLSGGHAITLIVVDYLY
jgi:hypothetical protein